MWALREIMKLKSRCNPPLSRFRRRRISASALIFKQPCVREQGVAHHAEVLVAVVRLIAHGRLHHAAVIKCHVVVVESLRTVAQGAETAGQTSEKSLVQ